MAREAALEIVEKYLDAVRRECGEELRRAEKKDKELNTGNYYNSCWWAARRDVARQEIRVERAELDLGLFHLAAGAKTEREVVEEQEEGHLTRIPYPLTEEDADNIYPEE